MFLLALLFTFFQAPTSSMCLEPLAFRLSEEESSPVKVSRKSSYDEQDIHAEVCAVGLPDDLKMTSGGAGMNRSFSAPPGLVSIAMYLRAGRMVFNNIFSE